MIKRSARMWVFLAILGLLSILPPGFARDFLSWRTDGVQVEGSSVGQQSSHQAFNLFDVLTDLAAPGFALYWKSAKVTNVPGLDNRDQDPEVRDWNAWVTAQGNPGLPRPAFTPNVPQAWSPVVIDLDNGSFGSVADHFLVNATLEPPVNDPAPAGYGPTVGDAREQIIAAYVPETARGLFPLVSVNPADANRLPPVWRIRTRALASIAGAANNVGVVAHPPILARVPAFFTGPVLNPPNPPSPPRAQADPRTVLFLVIGDGENSHARVVCLNIPKPQVLPAGRTYPAPDPAFFNPATNTGDVMWSYEVRARADGASAGQPVPVAGISFANVGDSNTPRPLLYITTRDGQLICLNAKAWDNQPITVDTDGAFVNNPQSAAERAEHERWTYRTPDPNAVPRQGFEYGMSAAVTRTPLSGAYPGAPSVVTNALSRWQADEWLVFVADTWGVFRGFDAKGVSIDASGALPNPLTRWQWRLRWKDAYLGLNPMVPLFQPRPAPIAVGGNERFVVPPVVYQGNTPMSTSTGALVNGSSDVGFDDEVIFAAERGRIYTFDALGGGLMPAAGADNGRPHYDPEQEDPRAGLTPAGELRWRWPENDTPITPVDPTTTEPRTWPRELAPFSPPAALGTLGPEVVLDADYFCRAALGVSLGANSSPDSGLPNLDIGDDLVFVPYLHRQGLVPAALPARRALYEYIGSLKPYGFVQAERQIGSLTSATATFNDPVSGLPVTHAIPFERMRLGTVKTSGVPVNQAPPAPGFNANDFSVPDDTVYIVSQSWQDTATGQRVVLPLGATVTLNYTDINGVAQTDNNLPYPSCYRQRIPGDATTISRVRASLGVDYNRLQLRSRVDTPQNEGGAEVDEALFSADQIRPPSLYSVAGANLAGTVLAPSWFRGRIIALTNRLRTVRVVPGFYDPALETGTFPTAPFFTVTIAGQAVVSDPGEFIPGDEPWTDRHLLMDVGASVTAVDGWLYVTYRNGHTRGYSVRGGGAGGTGSGGAPPIYELPPPANTGNLVRGPFDGGTNPGAGIFITSDPANPTDTTKYLHTTSADRDTPLLLEYGQTVNVVVDFGAAALLQPQPIDTPNQTAGIDPQIMQNDLQAQIRSSNGAVQQLPGASRGVRPRVLNGRIIAVIPIFAGVPSPTNPLTPGTPLLWEREPQPANPANNNDFDGELTYDLQVTQQGLQWLWGPFPNPGGMGSRPDPAKQHFWESERNNGATRFPTSGGTNAGVPIWNWSDNPATATVVENEWAPLVSYNNPLAIWYDPDLGGAGAGIWDQAGQPQASTTLINAFTNRLDRGRKNGDPHATAPVDGARSSTGRPLVPVLGTAIVGGQARQIVFGAHGQTTPATTTPFPEAAVMRVVDRSMMAAAGRPLSVRVQRPQLTKIGRGAAYGNPGNNPSLNNVGPNTGSFEQNFGFLDDGPDGNYPSIAPSRLLVTKQGTNLDLANGPVTIPGRIQQAGPMGTTIWSLPDPSIPAQFAQFEKLAVQVDIPQFQPDDLYGTRWRSAGPLGAPTATGYNPFFPGGSIRGEAPRPLFDRAEKRSQPGNLAAAPAPAPGEDVGPPATPDDDRLRRCVLFVDANGNGQLDLLPTYREAYRTFGVQVAVKPDMRIETNQGLLDLGDLWQGKKQAGLTQAGPGEIREWQWMTQQTLPLQQRIAAFYRQYWRPVELRNTGNVNLAFVKPELIYTNGANPAQVIGMPGEGNDPWRALSFVNPRPPAQLAAAMADPLQLFLRTSFDDQLLPDAAGFYGSSTRGVWVQKAPVGAALPGSVAYVDPSGNPPANGVPNGQPLNRDPSPGHPVVGVPRDTFVSLNIPTGTPLGQYTGSIRFFNDRAVGFSENPNAPAGYLYNDPAGATAADGLLNRLAPSGEPVEPVTDPPVRIKVRVIENMINGRGVTAAQAESPAQRDRDRRIAPVAVADASASAGGQVRRIMLAYASDRAAVAAGRSYRYDLLGSQLNYDPNRLLFPFDELPLVRDVTDPWRNFSANLPGFDLFTQVTGAPYGGMAVQVEKPSLAQDGLGLAVLAATERRTLRQGGDEFRMFYQGMTPTPGQPILIYPGGQAPDVKVPRVGLRMVPVPAQGGGASNWLTVYAMNQGVRRNLAFTWSPDPSQTTTINPPDPLTNTVSRNWAPEAFLATSRSLSSVNDPQVFITDALGRTPAALPAQPNQPPFLQQENAALPPMAWIGYAGSNNPLGRTDVHLSRYRVWALTRNAQRGVPSPAGQSTGKNEDYAQVAFPPTRNDVLRANTERTRYVADGVDWLVQYPYNPVQVWMGRADVVNGQPGSLATPRPLLANVAPQRSGNGELIYSNIGGLPGVQAIVDPSAGIVRFSRDARAIAGSLIAANTPNTPDPVISADYTPTTLRVTTGDASANDPVIVPVLSQPGAPVMDASWYRQALVPNAPQQGVAVAGQADRLWVFWRRSSGRVSGGPTVFYKVLRPGIRVRAGAIYGLGGLSTTLGTPEEVNVQTGGVFFPHTHEGQPVNVTYDVSPAGGNQSRTEQHVVTWIDETGDLPVPMDFSVNEGSIDAFASYEDVVMGNANVRKMEKIWLFWSSTRGSGGDLMFATLAPRIGAETNVGGSLPFIQFMRAGSAGTFSRQLLQQFQASERTRPFTLPPVTRRGPYVPRSRPARAAAGR